MGQTRDPTTGQLFDDGAAHVYGLGRNMVRQTAGTYNSTQVLGFLVEAQPSADDTAITSVDGAAVTAIDAATFIEGTVYPIHASSVTVGTGGEFLLFLP